MPHSEGFPLAELPEEVERLDAVEAVALFEPVVEEDELSGVAFTVETEAFLTDGEVLAQAFLFLLLKRAVVDYLEVVGVHFIVLGLLEIDELVDVGHVFEHQFDVSI
jgi:hypothetical protein